MLADSFSERFMDVLGLYRLENEDQNSSELSVVILSVVCYAVSILILSTHLIVFSITRRMWTTMGKNLAAFCVSTILGFCVFMSAKVVKNDHKLMYAVGIVLSYYCSLTHSSWLLSMSIECWRSFTKTKARDEQRTNAFVWYSVFSWLEPAILLALVLYAEFFNIPTTILPSSLKPTFFSHKGAYFQPTLAFLIFFGGPLCFNLLLSIMFLKRTKYLIRRFVDPSNYAENTELIWEFKMYFRLIVFIMMTWLANLIDAFLTRSIICNVVIVSLSVIQALYILLVFTFNNKISTLMHYEDEDLNLQIFLKKKDLGSTWGRSDVL